MRDEFIATLVSLAEADQRVILLTADLGFSVLEPFAERFPERYFNVGVAESNMVTIATGLAREGMLPFCYSIAAFVTMRCFEAFRDGPVLHDLPVRLVGVGGGVGYGVSGITHFAIEDLALMRSSGRVAIYAPPTSSACGPILRSSYLNDGPVYYRLGKDPIEDPRLDLVSLTNAGYCKLGNHGVAIVTYGRMASAALEAAQALAERARIAVQCVVISHLSSEVVRAALEPLADCEDIVTLEDHSVSGGIGSMVAEYLATLPKHPRLHRLGFGSDVWSGLGGSERRVLARNGLAPPEIAEFVRRLAQGERSLCSSA